MTPRTRLSILALILGAPFVFVVLRLTQLQIRDADRYETLSIDRRRAVHQTEPRRGRILDRRGEMLATRKSTYDLYFALGELPFVTNLYEHRRAELMLSLIHI